MSVWRISLSVVIVACGGGGGGATDGGANGSDATGGGDDAAGGTTLSDMHPGDTDLGSDPAVVWFESFEEGTVDSIAGRYDQVDGAERMELVTDHVGGAHALALTAGNGVDAVDLYKQLPNADEWYVRWYAKYDANAPWHHAGMWFGGYNPGMPYPSPMAGYKPNGDDRFSIAIEPTFDGATGKRFDFYNYWMGMHSWMETPTNDGTSYYGNSMVHRKDFTLDETQWVCLEVHAKLNSNAGTGAVLEVWKQDALVMRFDDSGPAGYWSKDKFCTQAGDGEECTDYPAAFDTTLDLDSRSTTALQLNAFWPQNYITDSATGTLVFDQMVVATQRIGCMR